MSSIVKSDPQRRSSKGEQLPLKMDKDQAAKVEETVEMSLNENSIKDENQIQIPEFIPPHERDPEQQCKAGETLMWSGNHNIPDEELDCYIQLSKKKSGYNEEQSLALLLWHKYDVTKAILDQSNFEPIQNEWNDREKQIFNANITRKKKNFIKLQKKRLPSQTVSSCVRFYYNLKVEKMKAAGGIVNYKMEKENKKMSAKEPNTKKK